MATRKNKGYSEKVKFRKYKGSWVIQFPLDDSGSRYFGFGRKKCQLLSQYLSDIKYFAENGEVPPDRVLDEVD